MQIAESLLGVGRARVVALPVCTALPPILAPLSPFQRMKACWEYAGRNALHRLQQPKAACALEKRYPMEGQWVVR